MGSITLRNVRKKFGGTTAVDDISLDIRDGEFFCVLGPPGAGKTTLLRLIVGLETPDSGEVRIDGAAMSGVHPSKRDIAMIFQNLALYPDKSVYDNIAFPLRQQSIDEKEIDERVRAVARQLKIDWLLEKLPSQLSGGERQRVAIGRAIVRRPKAYLMDEPLSNLDALLRLEMRVSLKELQTSLKETFVYVTHDQVEALSMGDRIAILDRGAIQQIGEPAAIYRSPNNMFVATVLGNPPMNFVKCAFSEGPPGTFTARHPSFAVVMRGEGLGAAFSSAVEAGEAVLGIRPEDVAIRLDEPPPSEAGALVDAEIYVTEPLGNETIVDIKVGEAVIKVLAGSDFPGQPGRRVRIRMNGHKLHVFDPATHRCLHHASDADDIGIRSA